MFKRISEGLDGGTLPRSFPVDFQPSVPKEPGAFFGCTCGTQDATSHEPDCAWWDSKGFESWKADVVQEVVDDIVRCDSSLDLFDDGQQLPLFLRRQAE